MKYLIDQTGEIHRVFNEKLFRESYKGIKTRQCTAQEIKHFEGW